MENEYVSYRKSKNKKLTEMTMPGYCQSGAVLF